MKKIITELKRIFPNRYVNVRLDMSIDQNGIFSKEYEAYISGFSFGKYNVTEDFDSLKELDEFLAGEIKNYKRQVI